MENRNFLLIIHHIENGVCSISWHENIEDIRKCIGETWEIKGYEIYKINGVELIEEKQMCSE